MSERDDERERQRRAKKAQRERERVRRARAAGLTRAESRSLRKTVKEKPTIAGLLGDISPTLSKQLDRFVETVIKQRDPDTGELREKKLQKAIFRGKKQKPRLTDAQKKRNREAGLYKRFVRANPDVSARNLPKLYRERTGRSIGSDRSAEIVREVRGLKKQENKSQRYPTVPYGTIGTPLYLTKRYNYVMRYKVLTNDEEDFVTRYMTIQSDTKMTKRELVEEVLRAFEQGDLDANEYYTAVYIDPESIEVDHLIDRDKKTKMYTALEKKMRVDRKDVTPAEIAIAYRQKLRGITKANKQKRKK